MVYVYMIRVGAGMIRAYRNESDALQFADEYNAQFARGARATVVPMKLHDEI